MYVSSHSPYHRLEKRMETRGMRKRQIDISDSEEFEAYLS
jgi:hypothetical protein